MYRLLIPGILLLLQACAGAQTLPGRGGEVGGFITERLQRIDRAMEQAIEDGEIPGAVALIMKDGEVAYHRAFGLADIDSAQPMREDSIFRIASMTKAIVSVAVMQLYEQGHFLLNDPVSDYLPEFGHMRVAARMGDDGFVATSTPAKQDIRIIDLLTHTSGISYPFIPSRLQKTYVAAGLIDGVTAANVTLAEQMAVLARQPLLTEPRSTFTYGLSTDVLGYLVEIVSGMPLDRYIASNISGPLDMPDTGFYQPAGQADRLVTLYAEVDGTLVVSDGTEADIKIDNPRYPVDGARAYFSGGAGMSSTARDYARFCQMLLNEGELDGARILGRKSVELMRTPRVVLDASRDVDFGLGFRVMNDMGQVGELGSSGSYAWGGAFFTTYWIDPEEQLVAVFMSQVRPYTSDLGEKFSTLVYQALE